MHVFIFILILQYNVAIIGGCKSVFL